MLKRTQIFACTLLLTLMLPCSGCNINVGIMPGETGTAFSVPDIDKSEISSNTETIVADDNEDKASSKDGKNVYLAGPMFSKGEKDFNLEITKVLEDHGYNVFLPQRDGLEAPQLEGKTPEEKTQIIFDKDYNEVMKADIVFMVLDGRVPDEGAAVELGLGYAAGKRCYGVKTDPRSIELDLDLNPMIGGCFIKLFEDYDGEKLIESLDQYLSECEL